MFVNMKKVAVDFQKGRITKRELLKFLSPIILDVPLKMGTSDKDIRYDFYGVISGKIDGIMSKYRSFDKIAFESWFRRVCKNKFINFIKVRNKNINLEISQNYSEDIASNEEQNRNVRYNIDLSKLSDNEKKVFRFKYGLNDDFTEYEESAKNIMEKLERKRVIEDKISFKYVKLMKIQYAKMREFDGDKIRELDRREEKIRCAKKRLEEIYHRINVFPSNKYIAKKLGISDKTVSVYLNRIKQKINNQKISNIICYE